MWESPLTFLSVSTQSQSLPAPAQAQLFAMTSSALVVSLPYLGVGQRATWPYGLSIALFLLASEILKSIGRGSQSVLQRSENSHDDCHFQ